MSRITTHVLDTARGKPASGVPVRLDAWEDGTFRRVAEGQTDGNGNVLNLLPADQEIRAGTYRLYFDTGAYFRYHGIAVFYPEVSIVFLVRDPDQRYHMPLLLGPYGYSTHRGA